jgi:plastocyanin
MRTSAALAGAVAGVAAVVALAGAVNGGPPHVAGPAAPGKETPAPDKTVGVLPPPPPTDDRLEFCTDHPSDLVDVTTSGTELKYDKGCYVARAGTLVKLVFTNRTTVPHNVVVAKEGEEAFAKTETIKADAAGHPASYNLGLNDLAPGIYALTCDVHPQMHAMLYVP